MLSRLVRQLFPLELFSCGKNFEIQLATWPKTSIPVPISQNIDRGSWHSKVSQTPNGLDKCSFDLVRRKVRIERAADIEEPLSHI